MVTRDSHDTRSCPNPPAWVAENFVFDTINSGIPMMKRCKMFWGIALAMSVSLPATARVNVEDPGQATEMAFESQLAAEQSALARERAAFPAMFAKAYAQYPHLTRGSLESIAYVQSRWVMLDGIAEPGAESAPAVGLMGLYQGGLFHDQVGEAARLLGVKREQVMHDPQTNILGAAALLDKARQNVGADAELARVYEQYSGLRSGSKSSAVGAFARESFAYDVLLAMDRGSDDHGIRIQPKAIQWERQFKPDALVRQKAPFVRLDVSRDLIEIGDYAIDPLDETLQDMAPKSRGDARDGVVEKSTDYGPALWVASPNYNSRGGTKITDVTIHTMQGSYAGSISWFQNSGSQVSAHYLLRSSDGQVTQMVRNSNRAWHVGNANSWTIGLEHEGYVNNAAWYTTAMYNASAALTRHLCSKHAISCASAYKGAASSGINVLPVSTRIKGHQHYSGQSHTDPGINWNWSRYYGLLNPAPPPPVATPKVLDTFESSEGHFATAPAYSGSTTGISASSTAERDCAVSKVGSCSEHLRLVDKSGNTQNWSVRLLSGSGSPSANTRLPRNGKVGFWVYVGGTGFKVGLGIDDSDGTERSVTRAVAANTWTWVEWNLTTASQWNAWVGGNGAITAANVTLDAIWIERAHTTYTVNLYLDDVRWKPN